MGVFMHYLVRGWHAERKNIDFLPRELRCFIPQDNEQRIPGGFLCNTLQTAVYICSEKCNFL